ncbi:MAG TPA: GGDEF domain-containing protein [Usitatibacter sp.]|nr:GGDEF domain-containing protein [Usitatibacter sp.]
MILDLPGVVRTRRDPDLLDRHRAEVILGRVRAIAPLFAILTLGWTAVDAVAFDRETLARLAMLRVPAAAAFVALALACRRGAASLGRAEASLALLFAIPALLLLAAWRVLSGASHTGLAPVAISMYEFLPFVLAAGIAAFPLSAVEAAALATIALLAEGWAVAFESVPAQPNAPLGAFWLLTLVAAVCGYASTSQMRLLEELVRQAARDPLTGCYRRESGREFLDVQFLIAARHGAPLAVLFADLDGFKRVNDDYGHEEGDRVLASAAGALRDMVRESDLVLRWGGEEFVVVLPHTTKREAVALLERLRERGLGTLPDGRVLTLSVGVAELLSDGPRSVDELVELADRRMYSAKQAGRNRYADGDGAPCLLLATEMSASSR